MHLNNIYNYIKKNNSINDLKKICIIYDGTKYTYSDLFKNIKNIELNLKIYTKTKKIQTLIILENSFDFVSLLLVFSKLKLLCSPVNEKLQINQLKLLIEKYNFNLIITSKKLKKINISDIKPKISILYLEDLVNNKNISNNKFEKINTSKNYIISFSSGSTGKPKPILYDQKIKIMRAKQSIKEFKLKQKDIIICPSPFHHSLGLRLLFIALINKSKLVLMKNFNYTIWKENVMKYNVSFAIVISNQLNYLIKNLPNFETEFKSLRILVSSSASLTKNIKKKFISKTSKIFYEMYGTAELATVSIQKPKNYNKYFDSVGKICPNVKVKILSKDNKFLKSNQLGEIICKSNLLFNGYFNEKVMTQESFYKNYFKTGDYGYLDKSNNLYFNSRIKDIIISSGINIYPSDIEKEILNTKLTNECLVFGIANKYFGELVFVLCKKNNNYNDEELENKIREKIKNKLAIHQYPFAYDFVNDFETLPSGKINKLKYIKKYNKKLSNKIKIFN